MAKRVREIEALPSAANRRRTSSAASSKSMIENIDLAKRNLTAEMCFINNERRKARAEDLSSRDRQESANEDRAARAKWKKMVEVS